MQNSRLKLVSDNWKHTVTLGKKIIHVVSSRKGSQNGCIKKCRQAVVGDGAGELSRHLVTLEYIGNEQCNSEPIEG